eukprot:jgi/Picsp_1/282/NSC_00281-R1_protein
MEKEREDIASQVYTQYDGDNDAIMRQTHTERDVEQAAGSKTAGPSIEWHFSQVFGERTPGEEVLDADIISAVEFDHSGDYLATGDQGGRVVLFERIEVSQSCQNEDESASAFDERATPPCSHPYEYRYLTEFQSHDSEFDYLKSLEIEEKVNRVRWMKRWGSRNQHTLLTTNDKTIKLWKVYEKKVVSLADFNIMNGSSSLNRAASLGSDKKWKMKNASSPMQSSPLSPHRGKDLKDYKATSQIRFPTVQSVSYELTSKCRRTYIAAHAYHINSIGFCADEEMFLSADDLRINVWHLDRPDTSFTVVDIKPESMEDLTEVITCAEFHPVLPHIFAYGSSKGLIRLADMRASALCDRYSRLFDGGEKDEKNFFSEIVASVNDVKFIGSSGNHLLSRDYMTLKVWDIRYEQRPLYVHQVHDMIKSKLSQLYDSDVIFDKFDCCASGDGKILATGTYSNFFRVCSTDENGDSVLLESSRDPTRKRLTAPSPRFQNRIVGFGRTMPRSSSGSPLPRKNPTSISEPIISDFQSKIQHMSFHPHAPVLAVAAQNSLYVYAGRSNKHDSWS